jgi:hypothetical protein
VYERRFMVESYDPRGALAHARRGDLSLKAWLSSVRAVDEFALFARDDLRPFGLMCLRMTWKAAIRPMAGMPWPTTPPPTGPTNIRYRPGRAKAGTRPVTGARQGARLKVEEKL